MRADFVAGLTTAILLVPQAMAYATLAGLPPVVGLYASTLPLLVYAAVGTSTAMAVGPVALVSLMTASALAPYADASMQQLMTLAAMLALMVGVVQLALGALRLRFLTRLLSRPVLTGFTSAAALLIAFSQLPALVGLDEFALRPSSWHVATVVIGVGAIAALLGFRKVSRRIPSALIVLVVATVAVIFFGLDARGVDVVGQVPAGLPFPQLPLVSPAMIVDLIPAALAIALVGYLESFAVARALARPNPERIDANREWLGVGAANAASAVVGGYPIAGGFSRSAVNASAGAKTRLAGAITAIIVLATLALLTPLFTSLPRAALAAIVIVAVAGLLHVKDWKRLASKGRIPLVVALTTFGATLAFNIEVGLVLGIASGLIARRFTAKPEEEGSDCDNMLKRDEIWWCVLEEQAPQFSVNSSTFDRWHDSGK